MSAAKNRLELVVGDSHHQIVPHDPAAHPPLAEKCQTAEHSSFGDVVPALEDPADPIREPLVVRHDVRSLPFKSIATRRQGRATETGGA